jgi:hypothetical protein
MGKAFGVPCIFLVCRLHCCTVRFRGGRLRAIVSIIASRADANDDIDNCTFIRGACTSEPLPAAALHVRHRARRRLMISRDGFQRYSMRTDLPSAYFTRLCWDAGMLVESIARISRLCAVMRSCDRCWRKSARGITLICNRSFVVRR